MTVESFEPSIGVFVCGCGGNIGDVVDVKAVCDAAKKWKGVTVVRHHDYMCSKPAQDMIVDNIKRRKLNRVIVASCTPRMHLVTFHSVLERAGLNPYLLEFVNIREQCSWVHGSEKQKATEKAISLIRGGYERSIELEPLEEISEKCPNEVLIIGGGIAGIVASIELGNMGYTVHLLDRYPAIGGHMAKLTKVFPTIDCAQCILTPRMAEAGRHKNIRLLTYAEVQDVKGYPGNYNVKVYMKPRGIDVEKCRGCGACAKVCPVTCPDEFNEYKGERKAAYIPFPQAVPYVYTIDFDYCTRCGKCAEICPSKAINLEDEGKVADLNVGSIIVATGYELFDARKLEEYGYGDYRDVITMMDLERLTSLFGPTGGLVTRISDGGEVKNIAIILCAGSRDTNRGVPYCSRICCMYSLKQAYLLKEALGIDVCIYYVDIRATGRGYEELYQRAQDIGVFFIRGKVAEVHRNNANGRLTVRAEDTLLGRMTEQEFDLVALATPMVAPPGLGELASKLSVPIGEDGFVQEKHPKLDPVDTLTTGIFACGCALGPKDVRDTVSDALAAAAKASSFLCTGYVRTSPEKPIADPTLCDGCGACLKTCIYDAISLIDGKAEINPYICTGCGACVPACPRYAIDFKNSTEKQMLAQIRGLLADKKPDEAMIIAFVEKSIAYTGADLVGLDRKEYATEVRIVRVPSTALLSLKHLLYAFAEGADGIAIIEGTMDIHEKFVKSNIEKFVSSLEDQGIESIRIWYSLVELPAYKKIAAIFDELSLMVKDLGPVPDDIRNDIKQKLGVWG